MGDVRRGGRSSAVGHASGPSKALPPQGPRCVRSQILHQRDMENSRIELLVSARSTVTVSTVAEEAAERMDSASLERREGSRERGTTREKP